MMIIATPIIMSNNFHFLSSFTSSSCATYIQQPPEKLKASDGLFSTLCDVNITLRDVNNHAPVFSRKHYVASIEENLPIGMYECSIKFHLVMSITDQT